MRFSIIVPVFNVKCYLQDCLNSVLLQTFQDWECICVDDGSTDGSGKILEKFAEKDERFKIFHKENAGVSSARNLALKRACGEWVLFLDGDDILNVKLLNMLDRCIRNRVAEFYKFQLQSFWGDRVSFEHDQAQPQIATCMIGDEIPFEFYEMGFFTGVYKSEIAKKIGFDEAYIRGEDRLFLGKYITRIKAAVSLEFVGYGYRRRQGSAMHSAVTRTVLLSEINFRYDLIRFVRQCNKSLDRRIRRAMTVNLCEWCPVQIRNLPKNERKEVAKHWRKVLGDIDGSFWTPLSYRLAAFVLENIQHRFAVFMFGVMPHEVRLMIGRLRRVMHKVVGLK